MNELDTTPAPVDQEVEVTYIRRSTGTEVQARSIVHYSESASENMGLFNLAMTYYEAIQHIDGASGYRNKKESSDEDKARKKAYAIAAAKKRRADKG